MVTTQKYIYACVDKNGASVRSGTARHRGQKPALESGPLCRVIPIAAPQQLAHDGRDARVQVRVHADEEPVVYDAQSTEKYGVLAQLL